MTIYSVSDAYKTAIRARTRTDRVTGTLTLTNGTVLNLDAADLMSGSLTLDNQCVTGEELAFGCAYLGQAALNLRTDLSRHAFYGAKLVLHYGLQLPGGRWETVPLGVYTVAEAERRALYVSIKAYDNILALQQKYDGTTMQGTAYALLGQIAAACGLTLGQTEAEIGALNPNAALVCQLSGADGLPLRGAEHRDRRRQLCRGPQPGYRPDDAHFQHDAGRKGSARHAAADHRQPVCSAAKAGLRPGHRDDARRPGV